MFKDTTYYFEDKVRIQHHHFHFTGLELGCASLFFSKLKCGDIQTDSPLATSETQIKIVQSFILGGFHVKLSTRNRVHSPADSLGRLTPRAHALKGVLLNSASPDACEPSDRLLYHDRHVKDHISEISSQNAVYYTPSPPQKQAARKLLEVPQFFCGWRDDPAPSTVHALAARKKSPLLNDLRYNAKC